MRLQLRGPTVLVHADVLCRPEARALAQTPPPAEPCVLVYAFGRYPVVNADGTSADVRKLLGRLDEMFPDRMRIKSVADDGLFNDGLFNDDVRSCTKLQSPVYGVIGSVSSYCRPS